MKSIFKKENLKKIFAIGFGVVMIFISVQNFNSKIEEPKLNRTSRIFETEISKPKQEIPIQIPNLEIEVQNTILENETQNSDSIIEIQNEDSEPEVAEAKGLSISDEDKRVLVCIISGEAGWEPKEGKIAVAQCLLNAMRNDGLTASEVRKKYGYQGWRETLKFENEKEYNEVLEVVDEVFLNGTKVTNENILWFYNPDTCYSSFHERMRYVGKWGHHKFFAPW